MYDSQGFIKAMEPEIKTNKHRVNGLPLEEIERGNTIRIAFGGLHPHPAWSSSASLSTSSSPSSSNLCNILANMMCEAIYHFPMMISTSLSMFE
jgi:hypothetical protein